MAKLTVGLTGGLAGGKSTVAMRLREAGLTVVDADEIVADLYAPGGEGAAVVRDLFGEALLGPAGGVDKALLAELVFADRRARERLEARIFPLVRRRFATLADATAGIAVLEATKLVEAGFAPDLGYVVTVEAPLESRLERAVLRGATLEDARARIAAQAPPGVRIAAADQVIENSGDIEDLLRRADQLAAELLERARISGEEGG